MIGFSQANDLSEMFLTTMRDRSGTDCSNQTSSTNEFCDEIDEIMKHEQDDIGLNDPLASVTPLDLDLDSISDLLENPRSTSNFTQSLNLNDLSPKPVQTNLASAYAPFGINTKFPLFTLDNNNNNNYQQFLQTTNSHLPPYVQQDNTISSTLQRNTNGSSDVKRFRSASMNEGSFLQQQNKLDPQYSDPYRLRSPTFINPSPSYQEKPTSPINPSPWPYSTCPRPPSNSFSEVENQQTQVRLHPQITSTLTNTTSLPPRYSSRFPNYPQQTLYSINQATNENSTPPPTKKRLSIVDFAVDEIKDDPCSPTYTIEQQSETDLWSDIEQNSYNLTDDDATNTSNEWPKTSDRHPSSTSPPRFWKYNVQSKGPKTKRMLYLKERDPHIYREFSDPVYQIKLTQTNGHTFNKLRKGDGNDVTPNPTKLYQLGKQIRDLLKNSSSVYHGIYNVEHHTSTNDTIEAKKEKNKLASKTCRLRKKAQHEANKLKLHGLNEEHKILIDIIASIKLVILKRYEDKQLNGSALQNQSLEAILDQLIATKHTQLVAGNADGFVEAIVNEIENRYSQKMS